MAIGGAATARATPDTDYWTRAADTRDTVYRFVYGQSPQAIPSSYDPVAEAESILQERQAALSPSNPTAPSLWQAMRTTTVRSALSTPLSALGSIALGIGVFEIGWKIGSGANAKFLKLGVPEAIPDTNTDFRGNGSYQELWWNPAGYDPYFERVIQPVAGFTWMRFTDSGWYGYWRTGSPESDCDMNRVAPPAGVTVVTSAFFGPHCGSLPDRTTDYHLAYVAEDSLGATGPIETYTTQSYDRSSPEPTPPSQSTVEGNIDTALADPDNDELKHWINYQVGSPGESDPSGVGQDNPDIPWESWTDLIRHFETHGDEFDTPYEDLHEYWRDAAEIVEADEMSCIRPSDGSKIYWDSERQAIVIVTDGKIQTYFVPDIGFQYWLTECNS
ncbi:MAG TPA: hypothetical protein VF257_06035 [Solirubrobacteraceae bacterium]